MSPSCSAAGNSRGSLTSQSATTNSQPGPVQPASAQPDQFVSSLPPSLSLSLSLSLTTNIFVSAASPSLQCFVIPPVSPGWDER